MPLRRSRLLRAATTSRHRLTWPRAALAIVFSLAVVPTALVMASDANASISIAVTMDGLLSYSSAAVVAIPAEERAVWENGRIYTYTRVLVDRAVAGELAPGGEAWIRTMGGIIGKIGQRVEGEAVFVTGRPSLVFLHPGPVGAFEVTARGQGQFPVVLDEQKTVRLIRSSVVGALLMPRPGPRDATDAQAQGTSKPQLAAEAIHGRLLDDVAQDVNAAWTRAHGK